MKQIPTATANPPASAADEPRLRLRMRAYSALAFLATLAICGACALVGWQAMLLYEQKAAEVIAANQGAALREQLNRSLSATYAVASVLRHGKGNIAHFDTLAQEMLKIYSGISSLQLAKGGVITEVVPLAGNEKALGHDLLRDPTRNKEAFLAIDTHKLTLAGPFELVQGGLAVIGRLPVFLPDEFGADQFWGFATALIRIPEFLATSNLPRLADAGYDYQLAFVHPDTREALVFARSGPGALSNPVVQTIDVPNGKWFLSVAPRRGWIHPALFGAAGLVALLIASFVASVTRTVLRQPILLRREVAARTAALADTNRGLKLEIIERERARQCEAQMTRLYSVLSHANSSIARIGSRHRLLQEICHATVEHGGFPLAKIGLLDERSGAMEWLAQSGQHVALPQCDGARCQALARDNAMPGLRMIVCSRVQLERQPSAATCREAQAAGFSSHVMLQIKVGARVAGVFSVYAYEANFFDSAQLRLLQEMSDDIGFALDQIERTEGAAAAARAAVTTRL